MRAALLLAGIAVCGVNLFTGAPLLALWLGSQVQNERMGTSTEAAVVVLVVLLVLEVGLTRLLNVLSGRYDALTGRPSAHRQAAWLRSASGERRSGAPGGRPSAPSEKLFVLIVVAVLIALEIWFFVFAHLNLLAPSSFLG